MGKLYDINKLAERLIEVTEKVDPWGTIIEEYTIEDAKRDLEKSPYEVIYGLLEYLNDWLED